MKNVKFQHVYGPVPSRRLGRSLGIDLVPFKTCTYDCIYCQLGRTTRKTLIRKPYVSIKKILDELDRKLDSKNILDYISLSGSGEPTLHRGIGKLIDQIKSRTKIPVAVLTNGSLLWKKEVQTALMNADVVLPSLDAGDEKAFQRVNRPHKNIDFEQMVDGIASFTKRFSGEVWLEVFLLANITDTPNEIEKIKALITRIHPVRVQLNTIVRPPAETFALPVSEDRMRVLKKLLYLPRVNIIGENRRKGGFRANFSKVKSKDVLALLSRRPCTVEDIANGLGIHITEALKCISEISAAGQIYVKISNGKKFYVKKG